MLDENRIRSILSNHIRRMDHVKLLSSILSCKSQNGEGTSGMVGQKLGDVEDFAVEMRDYVVVFKLDCLIYLSSTF